MKGLVMSKNLNCLKFLTKNRRLTATILSLGSCLGAIAPTLQSSQAYIIGQDDRVLPAYEWLTVAPRKAVGQLESRMANGQYKLCTFTVVGRNIGLTNSHCVRDEQGKIPVQAKAYVVRYGTTQLAIANVDAYWTGLQAFPKNIEEWRRDWAIVRFTTNLGDATGWYGNVEWNPNDISKAGDTVVGQPTNYIGYPTDWPTDPALKDYQGYLPALQAGCNILAKDPQLEILIHDCDIMQGTSGSSMFSAVSEVDFRTMALNNGYATAVDGRPISTAVPLERFMPAILKLRQTGATNDTAVPVP
ncbi:serine protease [Chroococcidiopsis sp. CCALA 051]|uniref:trypsin-like serine peptidase n=1 Tax=Chroococcidiopsis sp. CCALA 051 TaxID=869949 RepID=UPI000D0DF058|nr:trypsin-like peptidase domain-containing protein [Chroococcidiopsis sp. CCALA 051]